jgi:hypothetical protein
MLIAVGDAEHGVGFAALREDADELTQVTGRQPIRRSRACRCRTAARALRHRDLLFGRNEFTLDRMTLLTVFAQLCVQTLLV